MIRPVVGGGGLDLRALTGVSQRASRSAFREVDRQTPPTAPPGRHRLGARASRPHSVPLAAAELQCDAARQPPCGREQHRPGRRRAMAPFRLIQVGEMAEAVPGFVRAGRPRSQEACHPMTSSHQGHQIAEAFWRRLWLKQLHLSSGLFVYYSCPFVVRLHQTIGCFSSNDPYGRAGATPGRIGRQP